MAIVPQQKAELLDGLLPDDSDVVEALVVCTEEIGRKGPSAARDKVNDVGKRYSRHPGVRLLDAMMAQEEGETGRARTELQKLLQEFPCSPIVRRRFLDACRASGNTALMKRTLESIVDAGIVPGIQAEQRWIYPPSCYTAEYAEMLAESASTRRRAQSMLHETIRRDPVYGPAWYALANLAWSERKHERALTCYRIAACLAESNDHFAFSYFAALAHLHREQEGLNWLEARARKFGNALQAAGTWTTWISALESCGDPERAIEACKEALRQQNENPEILSFAVGLLARMGHWEESEKYLQKLEASENVKAWHDAAFQYFRVRSELDEAVLHGRACVRENPRWMQARYGVLEVIEQRDGPKVASKQALQWVKERPGHDELENAYCHQLSREGSEYWKGYSTLLRRLRKNPEDAWACRQLAFNSIAQYGMAGEKHRPRLEARIAKILAECDRIAPEHPATLRAHALWHKARGEWRNAVEAFLAAIEREPDHAYSYHGAWECCASFSEEEHAAIWARMQSHLRNLPGHLKMARELSKLLAQRIGIKEVEEVVSEWRVSRPEDPEILEAAVDLLLDHGHGRSDAARALALLESVVNRFPYHVGLRLSLAAAYLKTGRKDDAEGAYEEIRRRHPGHPGAHLQLASIRRGQGKPDDALELVRAAKCHSPLQGEVWEAEARLLISQGREREAYALIEEGLQLMPENIGWRAIAINLYVENGENDSAGHAARGGVAIFPRGAYLWFLLAQTLVQTQNGKGHSEAESAARRSLKLNASLFASADLLVCLLAHRGCFEEANQILRSIEPRMSDPSPARGRLAWLKRTQASMPDGTVSSNYKPMEEAIEEMATVLRGAPSYEFGWSQLMEWLTDDKDWERARDLLGKVPAVVRADVSFRKQRLALLEKAGLPAGELDAEWQTLLCDFPEDVPLSLQRIDALREAGRATECAELLRTIHAVDPDNTYILARLAGIQLWERNRGDALETALRVWFVPHEVSTWPAEEVLRAFSQAGLGAELCNAALIKIERGERPNLHATKLVAEQILNRGKILKLNKQPYLRRWLPKSAARRLARLAETSDQFAWSDDGHRAVLLSTLDNYGYQYLVIDYWKKHPERVQADFKTWAQVGRALLNRKRRKEVRKLMSDWRERPEMKMWAITNYVLAWQRGSREALDTVAGTHSQSFHMTTAHDFLRTSRRRPTLCWETRKLS